MQAQEVRLRLTLSLDLDDVLVVADRVCLKLDVHFDTQASSNRPSILILAAEVASLGLLERDATHVFGDVADRNRNFVVLVGFDV